MSSTLSIFPAAVLTSWQSTPMETCPTTSVRMSRRWTALRRPWPTEVSVIPPAAGVGPVVLALSLLPCRHHPGRHRGGPGLAGAAHAGGHPRPTADRGRPGRPWGPRGHAGEDWPGNAGGGGCCGRGQDSGGVVCLSYTSPPPTGSARQRPCCWSTGSAWAPRTTTAGSRCMPRRTGAR